MLKLYGLIICFLLADLIHAQADNEIQVYASPTIQQNWTIFELHSNYTFNGPRTVIDPKMARWINETLEITHGFAKNFEIGFYTFTAISPDGKFQYLGNQIRPRISWPGEKIGLSLSMEFGYFRPNEETPFEWQGEIRPIIDKTANQWYFAFNPNIDLVFTGRDRGPGFSPQFKTVYTIKKYYGIGIEYYGDFGWFKDDTPGSLREHLIGPMFDLYIHPKWELNTGLLFGLTNGSNQQVFKLLLGRRVGK